MAKFSHLKSYSEIHLMQFLCIINADFKWRHLLDDIRRPSNEMNDRKDRFTPSMNIS